MNVKTLSTIDEVIKTLCDLSSSHIFRGHANSTWELESTLERLIGGVWDNAMVDKFEVFSLQKFQSKYHLYDHENIEPESKLAWLSLMQHYGVPTRLLDFTESPFVAIYFAIEFYDPKSKNDLAIFSLNYTELMKKSVECIRKEDVSFCETPQSISLKQDVVFTESIEPFEYDIVWVTEPNQLNIRLDRQSGSFLLSGNKGVKINDILNSSIYSECNFTKYILPCSLYEQLYALLRKMNINSKSIYGDLQGLGRALKMEMSMYA